jgi:hypothetical protein
VAPKRIQSVDTVDLDLESEASWDRAAHLTLIQGTRFPRKRAWQRIVHPLDGSELIREWLIPSIDGVLSPLNFILRSG